MLGSSCSPSQSSLWSYLLLLVCKGVLICFVICPSIVSIFYASCLLGFGIWSWSFKIVLPLSPSNSCGIFGICRVLSKVRSLQTRPLTQSTYIVTGKSRAEWHSSSWCSWSTVAVVLWGQVGQNLKLYLDFSWTSQKGMVGGGLSRGTMRNLRKPSLEDSSRYLARAANEILHWLIFVLILYFHQR